MKDASRQDRITCYVPIPALLPRAPVYIISLYPLSETETHIVLMAADDTLSQKHAGEDLPHLKAAILYGDVKRELVARSDRVEKHRCFISYRRYDSADVTGRIYDRLVEAYGPDSVFKDVDSIPLGMDFRQVIEGAVGECDVVLVVIGRDWLTVRDDDEHLRLNNPSDMVRLEIETALIREIPIIPLLVRDAPMPRKDELPETLQDLVFRNGLQIRPDPDFHSDVDRLISALDDLL